MDNNKILNDTQAENKPLLEVNNLRKCFPLAKSLTGKVLSELIAVDNVSFKLYPGETIGIVGESGCGKTTLGRTILKLHQPSGGQILFGDEDITNYNTKQMRHLIVPILYVTLFPQKRTNKSNLLVNLIKNGHFFLVFIPTAKVGKPAIEQEWVGKFLGIFTILT